jgi:peptidoglycan/LPS O-acetylase OafA/YrhL
MLSGDLGDGTISSRNPALDGLRALAVLLVLAVHSHLPELPGGFLGVDLFFVLSGFLITGLLVEEQDRTGHVDVWRFYARRALRLTPPLLCLLVAYLAVAPSAWPDMPLSEHLGSAALAGFYLSDYTFAFANIPQYLAHTWSLAVEEHYYLIWPLALIWMTRRLTRQKIIVGMAIFYAMATIWRYLNMAYFLLDLTPVHFRFDTHLTGLVLGSLLALSGASIRTRTSADAIAAVSLAVIVFGTVTWVLQEPYYLLWGQQPTEFAAAGLILALSSSTGLAWRAFSFAPAAYVGQISYAIYLWHYPLARYLRDDTEPHLTFAIVVAFSIPMAMLSWHLMEKPLSVFRHRIGKPVVAQPA